MVPKTAGLWHYGRILLTSPQESSIYFARHQPHPFSGFRVLRDLRPAPAAGGAIYEYLRPAQQIEPHRHRHFRRPALAGRVVLPVQAGRAVPPLQAAVGRHDGLHLAAAAKAQQAGKENRSGQGQAAAAANPAPRRHDHAAARPKLETYVPPVVAPMTPPPVEDMADMIAKRRAQRQANNPTPAEPAPETADERGNRIAKANIARAQGGKSAGADRDDTGGVFSIVDQTYHSADVKFRGWNTNFKRNWTQQVHVEQGGEIDIETAIVKKMIELIRKEKHGDFVWESHRLGREVPMSARKEDEAELQAFLLKEFFPEYRRGASR